MAGPTWHGWESDLLFAANLNINGPNTQLLDIMNTFASGGCSNNPVAISRPAQGSTDCVLVTPTRRAQNYTSHESAWGAFSDQLHGGSFPDLLHAFETGNPFTVLNTKPVAADLDSWVAGAGAAYLAAIRDGGGPVATPTGIHKGWEDIRKTINHKIGSDLGASDKTVKAALRSLSRSRKVRL